MILKSAHCRLGRYSSFVLPFAILLLAGALRLNWPALAEFKLDEATVVRRALAIAYEGDLPAFGVGASVGLANPPLFLYLAAIPLRVWPDPLALVLFIALLNSLAVLACYGLGQICFNRSVGLIAAFLFAVNPWAIVYGRKIWSQNLPLVTIAFMTALLMIFVQRRRWMLVGAFVGLAALIGLHLGGLAFIPVLLLPMLVYRQQVSMRPLLVGGLCLALAFAPYLIQDVHQGWSNLQGLVHYGGGEKHFSLDALRYAFFLTGSYGLQGMAGARYEEYLAGLPDLWWLNDVMMGLLAASLLYAVGQLVWGAPERRRVLLLLLAWFIFPIALQTWSSTPTYPHYFILLYPVQFLLIAFLVMDGKSKLATRLGSKGNLVWQIALGVFALMWAGWQIAVIGRLFVFMERYPTTGGYGIPLHYTRQAALEARQSSNAEIIVLGVGQNPAVDETPAVFDALLFGRAHRFADGRWALPMPAADAVYIAGPTEPSAELAPVVERLKVLGSNKSIVLPDGWRYEIVHASPPQREAILSEVDHFAAPVSFANGVDFLGYATLQKDTTLEFWLLWQVRLAPPPELAYHFFTHLLDREGKRHSQHDQAGFSTACWRAGDWVLSRFALPLPPNLAAGDYTVRVGMYTFPDIQNVPVVDAAGQPISDAIEIGLIKIE